jgi:dienelactone hydrolase
VAILKRFSLTAIFVLSLFVVCWGQGFTDRKIIDNGGAGTYKAIAVHDAKFQGYTIYRPENLKFAASNTTLPVIVFGNGDCPDTSLPFEKFLNEIASFGYVIIAVGPLPNAGLGSGNNNIIPMATSPTKMKAAIDLMEKCCKDSTSEYYAMIDLKHIAVMGHSYGGIQALALSADPRIATTICLNSAVFMPEGEQVGKHVLESLHSPVLYMIGGPSDVAYPYALDDYSQINKVFVSMANYDVGHGGTYSEKFGGSCSLIAMQWFEWQLKNKEWTGRIFTGENCTCEYPGWLVVSKNNNMLKQ